MVKMLDRNDSLLLVVDIQERLVQSLDKDIVVARASALVQAANILKLPIVITQQYTKGLGETVLSVKKHLSANTPVIEKSSFSAVKEEGFLEKIKSYNKKQIVLCGIETHICVHQTAADLIKEGFEVFVAKDACASRKKYEFKQGIERMEANGANISCVEIILFEWIRSSRHIAFKEIQALIK